MRIASIFRAEQRLPELPVPEDGCTGLLQNIGPYLPLYTTHCTRLECSCLTDLLSLHDVSEFICFSLNGSCFYDTCRDSRIQVILFFFTTKPVSLHPLTHTKTYSGSYSGTKQAAMIITSGEYVK